MSRVRFGWRRPERALRGLTHDVATLHAAHLPAAVDLSLAFPAAYDQGPVLGSCTGQVLAGAIEYLHRRQSLPAWTPSRLALYFDGRARDFAEARDAGATLVDVCNGACEHGYADEALWPYAVERFAEPPTIAYRLAANRQRLANFEVLAHDLATIEFELAAGNPVAVGVEVYRAFEDAPEGRVPLPARGDLHVGGHALLLVGYDAARGTFLVRNSWGAAWGREGYGVLPFEYVLDPALCGELVTVRAVRALDVPRG